LSDAAEPVAMHLLLSNSVQNWFLEICSNSLLIEEISCTASILWLRVFATLCELFYQYESIDNLIMFFNSHRSMHGVPRQLPPWLNGHMRRIDLGLHNSLVAMLLFSQHLSLACLLLKFSWGRRQACNPNIWWGQLLLNEILQVQYRKKRCCDSKKARWSSTCKNLCHGWCAKELNLRHCVCFPWWDAHEHQSRCSWEGLGY